MTRKEAFKEINDTQEYYVDELIKKIDNNENKFFKSINFTSPTGTGKTNMMALLIKKCPQYFFLITTLSKGQLNLQIKHNLSTLCDGYTNFTVYGTSSFTANTKLQADDIINLLPKDQTKVIWLRDEGHIHTNKWAELLEDRMYKIINFSATNKENTGVVCNFMSTMMLRTVHQQIGEPEEAIKKLIEVKKQHKRVKNYNPCLICRILDDDLLESTMGLCDKYNLKYINITTEDFDMADLCKDDNDIDVIFNKFKIVEGIDIRRAHVLYMDNEPSNPSTTIQVIGRCRRNALLYRDDIDIFLPKNKTLLSNTRNCYVYYNVKSMNIDTDENGELTSAFCDHISCQELKANSTIEVEDGQLQNGLNIIELKGQTGTYKVETDKETGFNVLNPKGKFYRKETTSLCEDNSITFPEISKDFKLSKEYIKNNFDKIERKHFDYNTGEYVVDGYDYIPLHTDTITLNLNKEQFLMLKPFVADKYNHIINKFRKYLLNLNVKPFEYPFLVKYKGKDGKQKYTVNTCYLRGLCNSVSLNFNYTSVVNYNKNQDITQFVSIQEPSIQCDCSSIKRFADYNSALKFIKEILVEIIDEYEKNTKSILLFNVFISKNFDDYTNIKSFVNISDLSADIICSEVNGNYSRTKNLLNSHGWVKVSSAKKHLVHDYELETRYIDRTTIFNDKESAIIGTDTMKLVKDKETGIRFWWEDSAVTSKVSKYCKFNSFIMRKYQSQIETVKNELFTGRNKFDFDKRANKCLGYCVEYYSKYLVYGEQYMRRELDAALQEAKATELNQNLIVRACMLKYADCMKKCYGENVAKVINTISINQLIQAKYKDFVKTVVELGTKTAAFVKDKLHIDKPLKLGQKLHNPNISIKHIKGLADYLTKDTIIDIKVTNNIKIDYIKQVLAYHYLSTKHSDLNIKHVIVYDAVSGKSVEIDL